MLDPNTYWYRPSLHLINYLLLPLAWLYGLIVRIRQWCYRVGIFKVITSSLPVIVVGNITVGGTGKTPLVIWLVNFLKQQGFKPGVVSRGYAGGDEPKLIAEETAVPVVINSDRAAAAATLLRTHSVNIVAADDGLQHYRLGRDFEIAVVDGARRFGNHCLLPAGPLREPVSRLASVNITVVNAGNTQDGYTMDCRPQRFLSLVGRPDMPPDALRGITVHAVAGIGHPERFFEQLRQLGATIIPHVFPDHYQYSARDLDFPENYPIIMTGKDAVKCRDFANERYWYLAIEVVVSDAVQKSLLQFLESYRD